MKPTTHRRGTSRRDLVAAGLVAAAATGLRGARGAFAQPRKIPPDDGKLRIIAFGAHPDDCELQVGGTGALWSALGHHVKFVSATNGDIGHWREAGGPLALRRKREVELSDAKLGVTAEVLDIHDGELEPNLATRRVFTRLIREWKADLVIGPRPNDYHPDHRYTGILMQDAAYMVAVPFITPDVPPLKRNPVFMYYTDRFQKPQPSKPDIAVVLDPVMDRFLDALLIIESQFIEGGAEGNPSLVPKNETERKARFAEVRKRMADRYANLAKRYRNVLVDWYGKDKGEKAQYALAYEVCEYGRQPSRDELKRLFPFVDGAKAS
jgi:LmbE family N-acetylglucosaminyl deacetylase